MPFRPTRFEIHLDGVCVSERFETWGSAYSELAARIKSYRKSGRYCFALRHDHSMFQLQGSEIIEIKETGGPYED